MHKLFLIDSLSPFFEVTAPGTEQNWSKAPFAAFEQGEMLDPQKCAVVTRAFTAYVQKVASLGYTAITLDDLAHAVVHPFYPESLKAKLAGYREWYRQLCSIAAAAGLGVYVTSDVMFLNESIRRHTGMRGAALMRVFASSLRKLFRDFDMVEGIVLRVGESDGLDVQGDFKSGLVIKTPRQCRGFIRGVLSVCEQFGKYLVFRTWTLGAYSVGDMMWNPDTFEKVFRQIDSEHLIISQKYGESDFFRHLNFNKHFFETPHNKLIELQARREYEGFGEFPSYVGNDYERFARYLSTCENSVGMSTWCQTGGWSHFSRLTYGRDSSVWNEINTFVCIRIFRYGDSSEKALERWLAEHRAGKDVATFIAFFKTCDRLIKELWYVPEFARRRLYFRRTRVPPLLWVFWDTIIINHTLRKIVRRFVHERREAVQDGYRLLHKIARVRKQAGELDLPVADIEFMHDTMALLALAREYYFGPWNPGIPRRIEELVAKYRLKFPAGFHVEYDFSPVPFKKWLLKTIFALSLRQHPHYRLFDRLFLLRFAGLVYPVFHLWQKRRLPDFSREQAMGIQVLFK